MASLTLWPGMDRSKYAQRVAAGVGDANLRQFNGLFAHLHPLRRYAHEPVAPATMPTTVEPFGPESARVASARRCAAVSCGRFDIMR